MNRPQPLWPDLTLEEKREKLRKTEGNLWELGRTNDKMEALYTERDESRARVKKMREDRGADGRWRRSESPRDPSPEVSDLANSPPPSPPGSSNESTVDVYTVAEHRRPDTIPPKVEKDEAQVVDDVSDREDDPSNGDGAEQDRAQEGKVSESDEGSPARGEGDDRAVAASAS